MKCSVVIPAHNEAKTIVRCLTALKNAGPWEQMEVIVSCNGCVDGTEELAAGFDEKVRVITAAQASKALALNSGDRAASFFPRIYLDADIELGRNSVEAIVDVLERGLFCAAAPSPKFKLNDRPALIRAFYRAWLKTPYMNAHMVGSGVYALSRAGKERLGVFPNAFGDDLYVNYVFGPEERVALTDVFFTVHPPRTLSGLLAIRRRAYFGNAQLARLMPAAEDGTGSSRESAFRLLRDCRSPREIVGALIYLSVCAIAKVQARRIIASTSDVEWETDESGRAAR